MKKNIWILSLPLILGCAIKPSKRMGVDEKFIKDSTYVEMNGHNSKVYILDSTALGDLDSLSSVSYFGTENGRHIFFQWSKIAAPPNDVTLFALDTTFCKLAITHPIQKENKLSKIKGERPKNETVKFKNKRCSDD